MKRITKQADIPITYAAYLTNNQIFKALPSQSDSAALQDMRELVRTTPNAKLFLGFLNNQNTLSGFLGPQGNRASHGIVWDVESSPTPHRDCACKAKTPAGSQVERLPVHARRGPDHSVIQRAAVHAAAAGAIGDLQRTVVDSGTIGASQDQINSFFVRHSKPLANELTDAVFQILRTQADPSLSTASELHLYRNDATQPLPVRYKITVSARGAPDYAKVEDETDGFQGNEFLISDYLNEKGLNPEDAEWLVNNSQHSLTAYLYGELETKFEEKEATARALEKKMRVIARELRPETLLAGNVHKAGVEHSLDVVMKHSLAAVALFLAYLQTFAPHLERWASDYVGKFGKLSESGDYMSLNGSVQLGIDLAKPEIVNLLVGDRWSHSVAINPIA